MKKRFVVLAAGLGFSNNSLATELVFENLQIKVLPPDNCTFTKERTNNVEVYKGTCSAPDVILLYQNGSYSFLAASIKKIKDKPPRTLQNLEVGELLTNSFSDGRESQMISFSGEDKTGRLLKNAM